MIARFLQRLTLIAFTAHAVLGCCWHHSHAIGNDECHHHTVDAEVDVDVDWCARRSNQPSGPATLHECHHHEGHSCESSVVAELPVLSVNSLSDCPCEHSHGCDEASCSYVPRDANPLDGFLSVPLRHLMPVDLDLGALTCDRIEWLDADRAIGLPIESSQQRCANLQSWQI